jgi:uncharacterized zinc-type alcohol dehydrogenase-like protein
MAQEERKTSHSLAVKAAKQPFVAYEFALNPLGPHDVELRVTHCGVCHSDLHTVRGEWGDQKWPIVPGHEIVGHVTAIGSQVKSFKVGDCVGVGPQAISCGGCKFCLMGQEHYCQNGWIGTYGDELPGSHFVTKGGYALYNRTNERFVFLIPDNLPSAAVGPIFCAGITTFTPMKDLNVGQGTRVGVIGIGGLGHMALQIARALGAEVTALSTSKNKEAEARRFGAHNFLLLDDNKACTDSKESFDVLINTASVHHDYDKLFQLLAPKGTYVQLGAPEGPMKFFSSSLVMRGRSVTGSLVGPPGYIRELLQLCSKHNILPVVEVLPWDKVNEAAEKVIANTVRYRMVLEMPKADASAKL